MLAAKFGLRVANNTADNLAIQQSPMAKQTVGSHSNRRAAAAGSEVEDGWEQAGRSEGSRSNRGRGRGSAAPQILQRQDRPTNARGQQGSTAAGQHEVHTSQLKHLPVL